MKIEIKKFFFKILSQHATLISEIIKLESLLELVKNYFLEIK